MTKSRKLTQVGLILFLGLVSAATGFAAVPNITAITAPRQTVNLYQTLTLSVTADVATSYQWYKDGIAIPSATNSTYAITNSTPALTDGWYYVIVTNTDGSTTSAVIWVNVSVIPGVVTGYGYNFDGETTIPTGLTNVIAVAGGGNAAIALNGDGTVSCWGAGTTNTGTSPNFGQSIVPGGLANVVAIAAGSFHSLALTSTGVVTAWGDNVNGQCSPIPTLVNPVAIAAAGTDSYALQADGTVVHWSDTANPSCTPPGGLTNVSAITAGSGFAVALKTDGTLVTWGTDTLGSVSNFPSGLTNVVAVASGAYHTLALISDGTVVAWGANNYGQSTVPSGLSGVVAVAANGGSSYALKSDGTVVGWGDDGNSQITGITALTKVVALGAGNRFNLALQDGAHSADYTHDGKFSLPELLRVISLYNYSSGGVRTGEYHSQTGTADGFAPGPGSLTAYHSADTNKDGKFSLPELLRVISLYNYSSGGVRTGQYHIQSGTVDGFAPGP